MPSDVLHDELAGQYGEQPAWAGLRSDGMVIEMLIAPGGGTWSLLLIRPDGIGCLIGAGELWLRPAVAPPGEAL